MSMNDSEDLINFLPCRTRNQTEKGKEYHLQILEDQRWSAQRSWRRKQLDKVTNLLTDFEDIELLKRLFLETKMEIVIAANQRLSEALTDDRD